MFSLLKSDIYKMFKRMSFYVCMFLAALSAGYSTWIHENTVKEGIKQQYARFAAFMNLDDLYAQIDAMSGKDLGITAWSVLLNSLPTVITFAAIFFTIFISSEFSSGMCKAVIIRGKSKLSFYFSKLISGALIPIIYSIVVCGVNFGIGSYKWQGFEWKQEYVDNYLIPLGWFLLVSIAWQSLLCMTSFICQSSGFSMTVNLGLITLIPPAILMVLEYVSANWFNKKDIPFEQYWLGTYNTICSTGHPVPNDTLTPLIWTVSCWFVIPIIIGIICFRRREIK